MTTKSTNLKFLLRERHWQTFGTFCREYDKAATRLDLDLVGTAPSRPQFHRWLSGALTNLPHPHHCRVLEEMLPGWTVRKLFESRDPNFEGADGTSQNHQAGESVNGMSVDRYSDVTQIYANRSEFAAKVPLEKLLDDACSIRASGISLNLLCQSYSDKHWQDLIENGASLRALFLEPKGVAVQARETEEGFREGDLSALTALNIQTLQRMRSRLPEPAQRLVEIGTYDEIPRFNILLIDEELCIAQPYLPNSRGVDSPTMVIRRRWPDAGLYPTFAHVFESAWDRRRSL